MGKPLPQRSVNQWHPTKNTFSASKASAGSKKIAWWLCPDCGHEWESRIQSHAVGAGCPKCRLQQQVVSVSEDPVLTFWSPENTVDPSTVNITEQSPARLWRCPEGHEWSLGVAAQRKRMSAAKHPCPVCAGRRKASGSNYLVDHPVVASQWDVEHNGSLDGVKTGSNRSVRWVCGKGHAWEEMVNRRFLRAKPEACPECTRNVVTWADLVERKPMLDSLFSATNTVSKNSVNSLSMILTWECPGDTPGMVRCVLC